MTSLSEELFKQVRNKTMIIARSIYFINFELLNFNMGIIRSIFNMAYVFLPIK